MHEKCIAGNSRTINSLEAFHGALNRSLNSSHPNLWSLIDVLKREEKFARAKFQKFVQGEETFQVKKYKDMNKRIMKIIETYDSEQKGNFLKTVAHNLKF